MNERINNLNKYKSDIEKLRSELSKWESEKKSVHEKLRRDSVAMSDEGKEQLQSILARYEQTKLSNIEALKQISKDFNAWIDEKIKTSAGA
ncbi:hypothetical protein [Vibrio cholerae]|uniref:hypothetical protein n=1 Tax=Vibrio cholerae TaxID=666 RepID=UPI002A22BDE4|nr:hypothetical protein [Vibrio cholerae]